MMLGERIIAGSSRAEEQVYCLSLNLKEKFQKLPLASGGHGVSGMTDGERRSLPPEGDEVSATEATHHEPESDEMFRRPPEHGETSRIVQSTDSWGAYEDASFGIFVDGVAVSFAEQFLVGVFGPKGFAFMCVCCGKVDDFMSNSCGHPVCPACEMTLDLPAEAAKAWRTQNDYSSPLEEAPYHGMSSGVVSSDSPESVSGQIRSEFEISRLFESVPFIRMYTLL